MEFVGGAAHSMHDLIAGFSCYENKTSDNPWAN